MSALNLQTAAEQWQTEGWVLLDGLVSRDEIELARAEIEMLTPVTDTGPLRRADRVGTEDADGAPRFRREQFDGTTLFPLRNSPHLNRLFVHPSIVAFACLALETDDLRIYQSRLWSKQGGHTDYEQSLHCDGNHSLVPIRPEPGFWFVEMFLYLSDVDERNGAPRLVPRSASAHRNTPRGELTPQQAPELYAAEVSARGSAGSLLAYRSDVWHRGTNIEVGFDRHVAVLGFRPASLDWVGFDAHAPLVSSRDFVSFAEGCTPDELALFGVPRPGHPYWTAATIEAMTTMYPGLDMDPWRAASGRFL